MSSVLTHTAAASTAVLAAVFVVASTLKLRELGLFAERLGDFELVPSALVVPAAVAIAVWELAIGVAVVVRPPVGAWLAAATLVAFAGVVAVTWLRGKRDISCACFGQSREARLGWHVVLRDVGLALLALPAAAFTTEVAAGEAVVGGVAVSIYLFLVAVVTEGLRTAETLRAQRAVLALPNAEER